MSATGLSQPSLDFTPRKPIPAAYPLGDYLKKLPAKLAALLLIMGDGEKHSSGELTRKVGHRFGDVIFRAHRLGEFHYQRIPDPEDDSHVFYRQCGPESCVICSAPVRRTLRAQVRILEAENAALRERLHELEVSRG
jgi:hypothetical protein